MTENVIKIRLKREKTKDQARIILQGPKHDPVESHFSLIWIDDESWKAVFWALELHSLDNRTWPKDNDITTKAEELGLFDKGKPIKKRLEIIGCELYNMLFCSEDIRRNFKVFLTSIEEKEDVPVIQLHIEEMGSLLQSYPWELMHDGHDFLFDVHRAFLVRHVTFGRPIPKIKINRSMQVLLIDPRPDMPADPPGRYRALTTYDRPHLEKLARSNDKFVLVDLPEETILEPTLSQISRYFARPNSETHILHIDAHGDFGWLCSNCHWLNHAGQTSCKNSICKRNQSDSDEPQGYLAFKDADGKLKWISGEELSKQLQQRNVQLVVLSACKSGFVSGSSTFNSIAGAMIKQGIPAIVAMQFAISESVAERFVQDLYKSLLDYGSLVRSVTDARRGVSAISEDSWYRPVLYLRTDSKNHEGHIFNVAHKPEPETATQQKWRLKHLLYVAVSIIIISSLIAFMAVRFNSKNQGNTRLQISTDIISNISFTMIPIQGGLFLMGSNQNENESPIESIAVEGFYISQTETTNEQYNLFIEDGGYDNPVYWTPEGYSWRLENNISQPKYWQDNAHNSPLQPVVGISWYEAMAFANWVSDKTGKNYRLPTEAEWEFACKGTRNRLYPWGNVWNGEFANFADISFANEWFVGDWVDTTVDDGYSTAAPVGSYPEGATPDSVMDMAGNVWEWTSSLYAPYPYDFTDGREDSTKEGQRSMRGGGWGSTAEQLRCTNRSNRNTDIREYILGFRLVHD